MCRMSPNLSSYYWFRAKFLGIRDRNPPVFNLNYHPTKSIQQLSHLLSTYCMHQCPVHPDYCYFLFAFFPGWFRFSPSLNHTSRLFFLHVLVGKWCGNLTHPAASEQASRIGCHCHWYLTIGGKYYGDT